MEILNASESGDLVLTLKGRLDATWSSSVEQALSAAIRAGHHRIHLDMADVDYISSAGLGVLLHGFKELGAIHGTLSVRRPSSQVAEVLKLSGLESILAPCPPESSEGKCQRRFETARALWEDFSSNPTVDPVSLRGVGGVTPWEAAVGELVHFGPQTLGFGVGAFADSREQAAPRLGEFLSVGGCAAQLPPGGSNRPDFVISKDQWIPSAWITSGLVAEGKLSKFLRFEASAAKGTIGLAEVLEGCLGTWEAAAFTLAVESAGLVGASLQQAPAAPLNDPYAFPSIRDRLGFTSERVFRDGTALLTGVVALPGSRWEAWLRPMGPILRAHVHAAAFPYRPLQKGPLDLRETVAVFFESQGVQTVMHLLSDPRPIGGVGESEFFRGACWVAPVTP